MLKFSIQMPKDVPFIGEQRIWWLKAGPNLAKQCLTPEAFATAREVRKKDIEGFARHRMPQGCEWLPVKDRVAFLQKGITDPNQPNKRHRLLCLTIDAGIGKTMAMLQTQFLRGCNFGNVLQAERHTGHLVIASEFDNLPAVSVEYLGDQDRSSWLVG